MSEQKKRIAVTGLAVNTPIGDRPETFLENLLAGRSAVTRWRTIDCSNIYCKIGSDLSEYDIATEVAALSEGDQIPPSMARKLRRLTAVAPWSTCLSLLVGVRATVDAGLYADEMLDLDRVATIVAGHNLNSRYTYENALRFLEEPDFIDGAMSLHGLDTDHAGSISELLGTHGPLYTVGGACASGNTALRCAVDEIRHHGMDAAVVVGAALDFSPVDLHAMALMGSISWESFNDEPERASRPFDTQREGFIPAHGCAALIVEDLDRARARGARIYAEILGVEASADANHQANPSEEGQVRLMSRLLQLCDVRPEEVDYVNAHATSTPLGDLTEIRSLRRVFGDHTRNLKINAPKSMLGHTCWAAPVVETVAAVLQMNAGKLHPSINIDELDPVVAAEGVDVCRGGPVEHQSRLCLKNSFGFGGINCVSLLKGVAG